MVDVYSTKSLSIASYLYITAGIKFIGINDNDPQNIRFEFVPKNVAEEIVNNFYTGSPICNARELFEGYKTLKDLIFEIKNSRSR